MGEKISHFFLQSPSQNCCLLCPLQLLLIYRHRYHYYYGYHDEDGEPLDDHHGIIVDVDFACWDGFEEDFEVIYVVHCTDGIRRFFSEDEVFKMS